MHARRTSGGERGCAPPLSTVSRESILDVFVILGALLLLVAFVTGCGTTVLPGDENAARSPIADGEFPPVQSPVYEDGNDNSQFEQAQPATLPADGEIVIEGTIEAEGDIDIYSLGPAKAGDVIVADATGHNGLNTVGAIFDGYQDLIDANNDRAYYSGNLNPYIGQVVREDSPNLFLGIAVSTATHFASNAGGATGPYSVRVSRRPGGTVTPPRAQMVWLDFEGGESVQIALEPVVVMHTFSAEAMSSRFTGQTEYIIEQLLAHMQRDLAAFNVTLLNSRHHTRPSVPHTKLYFGNYNANYLGLADSVDTGNVMLAQEAIIYSEDIAMFEGLLPTAEEAAQALANIASHELGHLLGLEHTGEPGDLMATASSARQVLEMDADYRRARLERTIFPAGWQNGPPLLLLNVGRNPSDNGRWRMDDLIPAPKTQATWRDAQGLPDIPLPMCGQCAGENCGA